MWHHIHNGTADPSNSEQVTNWNKPSYNDQAKYSPVETIFTF